MSKVKGEVGVNDLYENYIRGVDNNKLSFSSPKPGSDSCVVLRLSKVINLLRMDTYQNWQRSGGDNALEDAVFIAVHDDSCLSWLVADCDPITPEHPETVQSPWPAITMSRDVFCSCKHKFVLNRRNVKHFMYVLAKNGLTMFDGGEDSIFKTHSVDKFASTASLDEMSRALPVVHDTLAPTYLMYLRPNGKVALEMTPVSIPPGLVGVVRLQGVGRIVYLRVLGWTSHAGLRFASKKSEENTVAMCVTVSLVSRNTH